MSAGWVAFAMLFGLLAGICISLEAVTLMDAERAEHRVMTVKGIVYRLEVVKP